MTLLRQKIERELDALDNRSMAAIYEQIRILNVMRRPSVKQRKINPDIEEVLRLTSSSKSNWSEFVLTNRDERL